VDKLNTITITVLPVGEFDSDRTKEEFDALIGALDRAKADLHILAAVMDIGEAGKSVQALSQRDPDLLLIVVSRGLSAQVIEASILASRTPCLVLPVQGNYALPSSALAVGACREEKLPVELLYGTPDQPEFNRRLGFVIRAANAYSKIKKSRIGIIGTLFPNLVSCRYDRAVVHYRLGATLLSIPFESVRKAMRDFSEESQLLIQLQDEITKTYKLEKADSRALAEGIKLHLGLKRLAEEYRLDGFAAECWSGCPLELGLNPCLGLIEDEYELACEGDVMLCLSLLIVRGITGCRSFAGDLYDLDVEGILTLVHCGAPASLCANQSDVILGESRLAQKRGFETITCRPRLDPGPVTVFRFYGKECDKLHLTVGEVIGCEQDPNISVKVRINGSRSAFLDQCLGNHYVTAGGDLREELKLLGKWLGITIIET
jgi:L-fucose isomerase-like protein